VSPGRKHIVQRRIPSEFVRLEQGFNQVQVLSEYRALRATEIHLWLNSSPEIDDAAMYQMIRFNEEIDQAISESAMQNHSPVRLQKNGSRIALELAKERRLFGWNKKGAQGAERLRPAKKRLVILLFAGGQPT
jgi:hypothetical protein